VKPGFLHPPLEVASRTFDRRVHSLSTSRRRVQDLRSAISPELPCLLLFRFIPHSLVSAAQFGWDKASTIPWEAVRAGSFKLGSVDRSSSSLKRMSSPRRLAPGLQFFTVWTMEFQKGQQIATPTSQVFSSSVGTLFKRFVGTIGHVAWGKLFKREQERRFYCA
jgi:hypothetical protein